MNSARQVFLGIIALVAASATISCRTPQTSSPEFVEGFAIVRKIHGQAIYSTPLDSGPLPLGAQIVEGYQISTGPDSYVDLDLGLNGDALRIQGNSVVELADLRFRRTRGRPMIRTAIDVHKGRVIVNVRRPLSLASRYRIRTASFSAGMREGRPCCAVGQDGVTTVFGHLRVTPLAEPLIALTVYEGTTYRVGHALPVAATAESLLAIATTSIHSLVNAANEHTAQMVEQSIQDSARSLAVHAAIGKTDERHIEAAAHEAVLTVRILARTVADNAAATVPPTRSSRRTRIRTEALAIQAAADAAGLVAAARSYEQNHDSSTATSIGLAAARKGASLAARIILDSNEDAEQLVKVRERTSKAVSDAPARFRQTIESSFRIKKTSRDSVARRSLTESAKPLDCCGPPQL